MTMEKLRESVFLFRQGVSNSYTQIFFARNSRMGILLMLVTLFDLYAGISGLVAVATANLAAYLSGLNRQQIISGLYGFNPLLVGLGLGVYYEPGLSFLLVLVFMSLFTLFVTVALEGMLSKYGLPYLSLPFLAGIWVVTLSARHITSLEISERGIYTLNEMYALGGTPMLQLYDWSNNLDWPVAVKAYFRSLGAIFFQYHLFAGLLVAIGLMIWSRIAFLFSVTGFALAFLFYKFTGIAFTELSYSYIGFNFILTSIAIGAFFLVPSVYSLIWVFISIPLLAFITISGSTVLEIFQLPVFSLPFNIIVLLLLYQLRLRERFLNKPGLVLYQQFSPEKNLYSSLVNQHRMAHLGKIPMKLPFWGRWLVTQAVDGQHTHKQSWKYAWDFEMTDEDGLTYKDNGSKPEHYHCFGKPVLAPADGYISEVEDGIPDNNIGDANLKNNWGNTVVVFHANGLFSQLSHLKSGSILVQKGQYVKSGEQLASCGNSGRSPYPHLHVQFQSTAVIGSTTIDYPFASFVNLENEHLMFHSSAQPIKDQQVSAINSHPLIEKAFHFVPGQDLAWEDTQIQGSIHRWKTETNMFNESCLVCAQTGAKAWFVKPNDMFMFTHFEGSQQSLLFDFYKAAYQVVTAECASLQSNQDITLTVYPNRLLRFAQDFIAPFHRFLNIIYSHKQGPTRNTLEGSIVVLHSEVVFSAFGKIKQKSKYRIEANQDGFASFSISSGETEKKYLRVQ